MSLTVSTLTGERVSPHVAPAHSSPHTTPLVPTPQIGPEVHALDPGSASSAPYRLPPS